MGDDGTMTCLIRLEIENERAHWNSLDLRKTQKIKTKCGLKLGPIEEDLLEEIEIEKGIDHEVGEEDMIGLESRRLVDQDDPRIGLTGKEQWVGGQ